MNKRNIDSHANSLRIASRFTYSRFKCTKVIKLNETNQLKWIYQS
jgi:hypothetical protein